jgi:hypothetical protein
MREMSDAEGVSEGARDDLNHAGAVVDQAIGYMLKQDLSGVAIASALLEPLVPTTTEIVYSPAYGNKSGASMATCV